MLNKKILFVGMGILFILRFILGIINESIEIGSMYFVGALVLFFIGLAIDE